MVKVVKTEFESFFQIHPRKTLTSGGVGVVDGGGGGAGVVVVVVVVGAWASNYNYSKLIYAISFANSNFQRIRWRKKNRLVSKMFRIERIPPFQSNNILFGVKSLTNAIRWKNIF